MAASTITVRRVHRVSSDFSLLQALLASESSNSSTLSDYYGVLPSLQSLYDNTNVTLLAADINNPTEILAFISFSATPPLGLAHGALSADKSFHWLHTVFNNPANKLDITSINSFNTFWISAAVYNTQVLAQNPAKFSSLLDKLFEFLFKEFHNLEHIISLRSNTVEKPSEIQQSGKFRSLEASVASTFSVYLSSRSHYDCLVKIRPAHLEDSDDLLPIFNNYSQLRSSQYGEFFLADLIAQTNENQRDTNAEKSCFSLVAEYNSRAVGLLSVVSKPIQLELIERCFYVEEFALSPDNIFAINLFCVDPAFSHRCLQFLISAFNCFAGRDYCLISLPYKTANFDYFLRYFLRCEPRTHNTYGQNLFLCHKSTIKAIIQQQNCENLTLKHWNNAENSSNFAQLEQEIKTYVEDAGLGADFALNTQISACKNEILAQKNQELADYGQNLYVVYFGEEIIGLIALKSLDFAAVRAYNTHFNVRDYLLLQNSSYPLNTFANIETLIINPLFNYFFNSILSNLLSFTQKNAFFYIPNGKNKQNLIISAGIQLKPAILPQRASDKSQSSADHALFVVNQHVLSVNRADLCHRIVFVGCSTTSLAAIEQLLLQQRHNFINLTLIDPQISSFINETSSILPNSHFPSDFHYDLARLRALNLSTRVQLIPAAISSFNSQQNSLEFPDNSQLEYDFLCLAPGLQCQLQESHNRNLQNKAKNQEIKRSIKEKHAEIEKIGLEMEEISGNSGGNPQSNENYASLARIIAEIGLELEELEEVYAENRDYYQQTAEIHGLLAVSSAGDIEKLEKCIKSRSLARPSAPLSIILHGNTLNSLTLAQKLVENYSVQPKNIQIVMNCEKLSWIEQNLAGNHGFFERITKEIQDLGIKLRWDSEITEIQHDSSNNLSHIAIKTKHLGSISAKNAENSQETKENSTENGEISNFISAAHISELISCEILLFCGDLDINPAIFRALQRNSLVYDGRIVVNSLYQTHRDNIFAAGPATKFSKLAGNLRMDGFDSKECGEQLASAILHHLQQNSGELNGSGGTFVPILGEEAKLTVAQLPCGLFYLEAHSPAYYNPQDRANNRVLSTTTPSSSTRVELSPHSLVISVQFLGAAREFPPRNARRIVGLPASYLNRLEYRYSAGEINDLAAFLEANWATALYHEQFSMMKQHIFSAVTESNSGALQGLVEKVIELNNAGKNEKRDNFLINQLAAQMPPRVRDAIQLEAIKFVKSAADHLPNYILQPPFQSLKQQQKKVYYQ
jgi:hypothetical protein